MMNCCWRAFSRAALTLLMLTIFGMLLTNVEVVDAAALRNGARRGARGGGRRSRADPDRPYFWMCPEVNCPSLSPECQTIEYIVFQYDYEVRGRSITVRCESCEYCLDGPFGQRRRRNTAGLKRQRHHRPECVNVECPVLPSGCNDERLTDLLVDGVTCKRCPACYDNMLLNNA